jgi:hypothetical protein
MVRRWVVALCCAAAVCAGDAPPGTTFALYEFQ